MGYCKILSQGDKIKLLRKKYNLKQEEIAGSDITRNLISEIETNKANLTKSTAEAVLKNSTIIGDKRRFKVDETVEYLMETENEQASKILDKHIDELKTVMVYKDNSFIDMLKEVESFLIKWDLTDKKIAIYELAGDYFCMQNELNKSIVYYEKALAVVGKLFPTKELLNILHKLCRTYGNAGRYDESISCCDFALNHFQDLSEKDTIYFVYNRAYDFYLLKSFEKALANIRMIDGMLNKTDMRTYFAVLDTKAVCLHEAHHYDEALELYNHLLEVLSDEQIDKRLVVHVNMADLYIALSDEARANDILNIIKQEISFMDHSSIYKANVYFEIGKINRDLHDLKEANKYYLKALEVSKKQKNYVIAVNILCELIDCTDNIENMDTIKNEVLIISAKQGKLPNKLIYKLISFYVVNKDISKVNDINNFALQFI